METSCLKWKDFSSCVQRSFQNLRKEEDFFDITLVGDDYKHVTAHKLVLSASSEYFKTIFSNNRKLFQTNALICLEGLNHCDLNNILDYIYHGEIQLYKDELKRFLGIAERLKLEGVTGVEQDLHVNFKTEIVLEENIETPQNYSPVSNSENQILTEVVEKTKEVQSFSIQSLKELDEKIRDSFTTIAPECYICNYCDKSYKNSGHAREHVETHFKGLSFYCTLCDSIFRKRPAMRHHIRKVHNKNKGLLGPLPRAAMSVKKSKISIIKNPQLYFRYKNTP